MANKKGSAFFIALALIIIGIITLLQALGVWGDFSQWWIPIILILVGIMVIIKTKAIVQILGWICLIYGVILLLMTLGLFYILFLWTISKPVLWILFGLILIL